MKNYSELICNKEKRQLSAKGYKFLNRCIDILAKKYGLTRYHKEIKPEIEKLREIIHFLIIDKGLNLEQIKIIIKKGVEDKNFNEFEKLTS